MGVTFWSRSLHYTGTRLTMALISRFLFCRRGSVSLRSDEELRLRLLSCSVVYYYFTPISVPVPPIEFVLGRFDDLVKTLFLFL